MNQRNTSWNTYVNVSVLFPNILCTHRGTPDRAVSVAFLKNNNNNMFPTWLQNVLYMKDFSWMCKTEKL